MSPAWTNFEADFVNANSWGQRKDGFPSDLLDALSPDERDRAVAILMEKLDGGDDWPIRAMAHLRIDESVSRLREILDEATMPSIRAVTATAIYELTNDTSMEDIVWSVAGANEQEWFHRLDAIHCLGRFKTASAASRLADLIDDPEYLVSYNAKLAGGRRA
jgi:HEAT repeat protein